MKKVTLKQIAQKTGVSIRTVSVVLNGKAEQNHISEAMSQKILKTSQKLNYTPNILARAIRMKRSYQIGVIVEEITNPVTARHVEIFSQFLAQKNYRLLLGITNCNRKMGETYLREFGMGVADGILNLDPSLEMDDFKRLHISLPHINYLRKSPQFNLRLDYAHGLELALQHLHALGHRRIGFISGPLEEPSSRIRYDAFVSFCKKKNLPIKGMIRFGEWNYDSGVKEAPYLINQACTAILGSNDQLAIGAIKSIQSLKLQVPEDISVVGFDNSRIAKISNPALTSVSLPYEEVSQRTIEALVQQIEGINVACSQELPLSLVVRESTAKSPRIT